MRAIILALLMLSGCSVTERVAAPLDAPRLEATAIEAPGFEAAAAEARVRSKGIIRSGDNETLALTAWAPEGAPQAIILAVHGYGDYGPSAFDGAARDWAQRGVLVYAYDQRGFGRNPSRGDWPGAAALIDDLGVVTALLRARHPDAPLTLIGESMGAAVVATVLGEGLAEADNAVLLAPAFWGGPSLGWYYRALATTAAALFPDKRWSGEGVVEIQASDNIEALIALGRDPLYLAPPSSREFLGLIKLMDRAHEALPRVAVPTLTLYGAQDEVVPQEAVEAAFERLGGDKRYEIVETGWHLLLKDLKAPVVWEKISEAILEQARR